VPRPDLRARVHDAWTVRLLDGGPRAHPLLRRGERVHRRYRVSRIAFTRRRTTGRSDERCGGRRNADLSQATSSWTLTSRSVVSPTPASHRTTLSHVPS